MTRRRDMTVAMLAALALLLPGAARAGVDTLAGALGTGGAGSYEDFPIAARGGQIVFARMAAFVYQSDGRGEEEEGGCEAEGGLGFCLQVLDREGNVLCWAERAKMPGWQRDPRLACSLPGDPAVRSDFVVRATLADEACGDTTYPAPPTGEPAPAFPYTIDLEVRDAGAPTGPIAGVLGGAAGVDHMDFVLYGYGGQALFAQMDAAAYQTAGRAHENEEGGGGEATATAEASSGGAGCGGGEEEDEGGQAFCLQLYDAGGNLLCWAERATFPGWQRDPRLGCVLPGAPEVRSPFLLRALMARERCGEVGGEGNEIAAVDGGSPVAAFPFAVNVDVLTGDVAGCGDGVLDPREECDDGNVADGDCCTADCRLAPADAPCTDDGNVCTADRCTAAGVCVHAPQAGSCDDGDACTVGDACDGGVCVAGEPVTCEACLACDPAAGCVARPDDECRHPMESHAAMLRLRHRGTDRLTWRWQHGAASSMADFRPGTAAPYEFCVYDARDELLLRARTRTGDGCPGDRCWTERPSGFRYRDAVDAPDGLRRIVVRSGPDGRPRITVRARGRGLGMPVMPVHGPLTVQLRNEATGQCWAAEHRDLQRNHARKLDAMGD